MAGSPGRSAGVWNVMMDGFWTSPAPVGHRDTVEVIDSGTLEMKSSVAGCKRFGNRDSWTWIDRSVPDPGGPPGGRQMWGGCFHCHVWRDGLDSWGTGESVFPDYGWPAVAVTAPDVKDARDGREGRVDFAPRSWGARDGNFTGSAERGTGRVAGFMLARPGLPTQLSLDSTGLSVGSSINRCLTR